MLQNQPRLEVRSKQIEIRWTCTRNSTKEPFLLYLIYIANFPDFLHYTVLHSGKFPFKLEILILLLEEVRHWWESWAVLLSFAVLLHVFPDTSFEGRALLFLFSACLLVWSMCSPISIPRAEQSAYNVITIPILKRYSEENRSGSEIKHILCINYHKWR